LGLEVDSDSDSDSDLDTDSDDTSNKVSDNNYLLADFEILAHQRPHDNFPHVDSEGVGYRDMDHNYDWSEYFGQYNYPVNIWNRLQAENLIDQHVTVDSTLEGLNLEQRKIYDTVVNQYIQELAIDQPEPSQLLLHLDRPGGTGKTVALLTTYAKPQELATVNRKQNPAFQATPTGIVAYTTIGKTLHSFLYLLVKRKMSDLSTTMLQSLQALFQDIHFLMIDEKSMVDLTILSLIDYCL
jgi:hypothetical protein